MNVSETLGKIATAFFEWEMMARHRLREAGRVLVNPNYVSTPYEDEQPESDSGQPQIQAQQ